MESKNYNHVAFEVINNDRDKCKVRTITLWHLR